MKKVLAILLTAVMLLALCTGCGGDNGAASGDPAGSSAPSAGDTAPSGSGGESVVLRLANSHNAEHITSQACQMFADLVNEKTDGRITIECHFAGELGDERSTIEQCQFGGLDFTRVSSGASAEFAPLMNALQMPYEYTSKSLLSNSKMNKKSAVQPNGAFLREDRFGILFSSHSASSSKVRFPARQSSRFRTASYCHSLNLSRLRAPLWTLAK